MNEIVSARIAPQRQDDGRRATASALRVTYFSLSFPELTQTFVFNEMHGVKGLGADVRVVALRPPDGDSSDLPERYGFGARIDYVVPGARPGKFDRLRIAASSALRLMRGGRGAAVWRLMRSRGAAPVPRWLALAAAAHLAPPGSAGEIIHCHFGTAGRVVAYLKALGLVTARATTVFHGYDITQYVDGKSPAIYRELFDQIELLLPISDRWRDRLLELGATAERIETLRLGIDCGAFAFKPRHFEAGRPIRLITVGRMTEKKGHRYTLEAVARLRAARPELDLRLDMIGSGPLLGEMQALIDTLGLADCVRLHGGLAHDAVRQLLDAAHIFVLPSVTAADGDMEGIPVSIMEAMAMGLPVVSTRHSGIPELVADGISGLLVAERDAPAIAGALERLADDPNSLERMGREGRAIVERDYNAPRQAERLAAALAELAR